MLMRRGFSASGTTALQGHMQQAVLEIGAIDDDVVGQHEAPLEGSAGDAAIEKLGFGLLSRLHGR